MKRCCFSSTSWCFIVVDQPVSYIFFSSFFSSHWHNKNVGKDNHPVENYANKSTTLILYWSVLAEKFSYHGVYRSLLEILKQSPRPGWATSTATEWCSGRWSPERRPTPPTRRCKQLSESPPAGWGQRFPEIVLLSWGYWWTDAGTIPLWSALSSLRSYPSYKGRMKGRMLDSFLSLFLFPFYNICYISSVWLGCSPNHAGNCIWENII